MLHFKSSCPWVQRKCTELKLIFVCIFFVLWICWPLTTCMRFFCTFIGISFVDNCVICKLGWFYLLNSDLYSFNFLFLALLYWLELPALPTRVVRVFILFLTLILRRKSSIFFTIKYFSYRILVDVLYQVEKTPF